jgi:ABC-type bacteriocin/lantibiotic exporter with double-glycine peptidase domain
MFWFLTLFLSILSSTQVHALGCSAALTSTKDFPLVQQQTDYTCGPASVRSYLLSQDIDISEEELAKRLKTNSETGTSAAEIVNLLRTLDFQTTIRTEMSLDELRKHTDNGGGAIVNIMSEREAHWALAFNITDHSISLMDPWVAQKYRTLNPHRFLSIWRGGEGVRMAILIKSPNAHASKVYSAL